MFISYHWPEIHVASFSSVEKAAIKPRWLHLHTSWWCISWSMTIGWVRDRHLHTMELHQYFHTSPKCGLSDTIKVLGSGDLAGGRLLIKRFQADKEEVRAMRFRSLWSRKWYKHRALSDDICIWLQLHRFNRLINMYRNVILTYNRVAISLFALLEIYQVMPTPKRSPRN